MNSPSTRLSFDALSDLGLSSFFSFEPESLLPVVPAKKTSWRSR